MKITNVLPAWNKVNCEFSFKSDLVSRLGLRYPLHLFAQLLSQLRNNEFYYAEEMKTQHRNYDATILHTYRLAPNMKFCGIFPFVILIEHISQLTLCLLGRFS